MKPRCSSSPWGRVSDGCLPWGDSGHSKEVAFQAKSLGTAWQDRRQHNDWIQETHQSRPWRARPGGRRGTGLSVPALAETRIGVVDLRQALFSSDEAQSFSDQLEQEFAGTEAQVREAQQEARELQERLRKTVP